MTDLEHNIKSVLYSCEELDECVSRLGKEITDDYNGKNLIVIGILKGSVIFLSDLVRKIKLPLKIEFITASSYRDSKVSSGNVDVSSESPALLDLTGKDVLIIEDILDTGNTLFKIKNILLSRNPSSVKICTLLDKPSTRVTSVEADYKGFEIGNKFVVGYGLDYAEEYRNLPYIAEC